MKQFTIIGVLVLGNIIFGLLWVGSLTTSSEAKISAPSEEQEKLAEEADDTALTFTENTFKSFYHYDNDNYLTRFNDLEDRAEKSIVADLKKLAATDVPEISFQNNVTDIQTYADPRSDKGEEKIFVILDTTYSIEDGNTYERSELLSVSVTKKEGQWIISDYENVGAIYPESEI
ncbi:hypothetical protein [Jeotgalibacillus soli]|uniref:Uncharacterized protein n=1 Tax=Jeotgalibacillus soli TaxID=889306 RepID=A0A0C2R4I3_9BACL|nr:hypothetical protein [Jeotgalibacillus soli]KIL45165.1 hypothetical protein KP78_27090 [Jeotgalibacillus soli]